MVPPFVLDGYPAVDVSERTVVEEISLLAGELDEIADVEG